MYIKSLEIENTKCISHFEMTFHKPVGWHVIIGDNSSGKTTLARAIALSLMGFKDVNSLKIDWNSWIKFDKKEFYRKELKVKVNLELDTLDTTYISEEFNKSVKNTCEQIYNARVEDNNNYFINHKNDLTQLPTKGLFSAGFGSFRRFSGGEYDKDLENSNPRAAAHITLFGEKYTLPEALNWLRELNYKKLEGDAKAAKTLEFLIILLNKGDLLPLGTEFKAVSSEGVFFIDKNGFEVEINKLSDGFRSILSITFELIRLLIKFYDEDKVFANFEKGIYTITLPGVVIIDEVDAHLHPTWQVKIGQWFTKYFPSIQFIITTHSPLICRAAENGSIWRLSQNNYEPAEILGVEKDKLIYGNILDAFETDTFGENLERSTSGSEKLKRFSYLSQKAVYDTQHITNSEQKELEILRQIFKNDAAFTL